MITISCCVLRTDTAIIQETAASSEIKTSLTLKEAIKAAHEEALKWNKGALLYNGSSVDKDQTQAGLDGRRRHWNIQFGIPGKTDWYLVTIRHGRVQDKVHLPNELDVMPENYFINSVKAFNYDSPDLLIRGKHMVEMYPGDLFAKGYNFGFTKDPVKDIALVKVIGWNRSKKSMIYLMFDAKTGKLDQYFKREQYKN